MQESNQQLNPGEQPMTLLVTFKVKPEMVDALKQTLLNDLAQAPNEPGYISMDLFAAKDDPNTLFLLERWQNQLALEHHFAQPYTQAVLELTETALTSPLEIRYLEDLLPLAQIA